MGQVFCINTAFCKPEFLEKCPFNYGVDFEHLDKTFAIAQYPQSDTAAEFLENREDYAIRLTRAWWIRCPMNPAGELHNYGYIKHFLEGGDIEQALRSLRRRRVQNHFSAGLGDPS